MYMIKSLGYRWITQLRFNLPPSGLLTEGQAGQGKPKPGTLDPEVPLAKQKENQNSCVSGCLANADINATAGLAARAEHHPVGGGI
jgi:hypothetical protein